MSAGATEKLRSLDASSSPQNKINFLPSSEVAQEENTHIISCIPFVFLSPLISLHPPLPDNEQLARSGTNCLETFAVSVGKQFFPDTWDKVCYCARDIFLASTPHQLISWKPDENMLGR